MFFYVLLYAHWSFIRSLFTAVVHFRTLPLGIQLLIVTGISVAYSVVLVPLSAFWVSKEWICYAPVGILSCMSGDLLGICLPSLRSGPQLYNILESHDNTPSAHAIVGYSHQPVGTPPCQNRQQTKQQFKEATLYHLLFIIVFTTYFLISNFFRSAVLRIRIFLESFYFLGDTIKTKDTQKKECPDKSKQHFGTVSYKSIHIFCSLSVFH